MAFVPPRNPCETGPGPQAEDDAEGLLCDRELARHLLHDCGIVSPFVTSTLPPDEIARAGAASGAE